MIAVLRTYPALYLHVAKLAGRALARRWYLLLLAPAVQWLSGELMVALGGTFGVAGGFAAAFVRAAAVSLVLFVGRGIIEQRSFSADDITTGLGAFLGDVMTVFFSLWIASMLLGSVAPPLVALLWFAVVAMPTFEVLALSQVAGFGMFPAAWDFMRRDAAAWLFGHLPILAAAAAAWLAFEALSVAASEALEQAGLAGRLALTALAQLPAAFVLAAFVYRGILFLTLDSVSPRRRAERWGGVPTLR
jgi:hypothetical protein